MAGDRQPLLGEIRQAWLARALAGPPTDRPAAEAALADLYAEAGSSRPAVIWTTSPVPGATESYRLMEACRHDPAASRLVGPPVLDRLLTSTRSRVLAETRRQLGASVAQQAQHEVADWLAARLHGVRGLIATQSLAGLGAPRRSRRPEFIDQLSIAAEPWHELARSAGGWLDSPWLALAQAASGLGASFPAHLASRIAALSRLVDGGAWWPYARIAVLSERPVVRLDADFRPHAEDGPAVEFPDWRLYAWHGRLLPDAVLEPQKVPSLARVLAERDPDLQRLLINRYGVGRFRADARAEPIDHDRFGTLWRVRVPDHEPLLMVEVINSTAEPDGSRRRYSLRVPPHIESALEAVAWTFGLTAHEYRLRLNAQS